jgi:hypothetical protein
MTDPTTDPEIEALQRAYDQLALMDPNARRRAIAYLSDRLLEAKATDAQAEHDA